MKSSVNRRSESVRLSGVLIAWFLIAISPVAIGEHNSSPSSDASHEKTEAGQSRLKRIIWKRPLLGGFDDPVTGTHINGQMFVDGVQYFNDTSGQFNSTVGVRRARLTFRHGLTEQLTFKASGELSTNPFDFEPKDLYLLYTGLSWGTVMLGNRKEPYGLGKLISARYTTLMEVALPVAAMAPGRNVGLTLSAVRDKLTTLEIGVFGSGFAQDGLRASGGALTGRATHQLIDKPDHLLHLGLAAIYRYVGDDDFRFRSSPEVGVTGTEMVDTGVIENSNNIPRVGLEFAYTRGSLSFQSEYLATWVTRTDDLGTLFFHGWYGQGSWFLTGESRPWERGSARFGQVHPLRPVNEQGKGAWEVALRLSRVDLTDKDVIGGQETNLTLGLNWYLSSTIRVMANYVNVLEMDRPGSVFDGNTMSLLEMRFQIEF